jgi:hypothetical protein
MPRTLPNFQLYGNLWSVHFIEADCRTLIGPKTRYYHFATLDGLRSFVLRCTPENVPEFERSIRAWSRGSNYAAIFIPIMIGCIGISNIARNARFESFHNVDILQLIASGMCFGVALTVLGVFLWGPRQQGERLLVLAGSSAALFLVTLEIFALRMGTSRSTTQLGLPGSE